MFTGIVGSTAKILSSKRSADSLRLNVEVPKGWKMKAGDSVSIDGVCVTVSKAGSNSWSTVLVPETLKVTSFGKKLPIHVNLELPLAANGRFDGHIVQGHVDTVGKIQAIEPDGGSKNLAIEFPKHYTKQIVAKGSVTVDGVSLTVVEFKKNRFTVALIPFTLGHTTLGSKQVGDYVNLEFDIIAKYLMRQRE